MGDRESDTKGPISRFEFDSGFTDEAFIPKILSLLEGGAWSFEGLLEQLCTPIDLAFPLDGPGADIPVDVYDHSDQRRLKESLENLVKEGRVERNDVQTSGGLLQFYSLPKAQAQSSPP